MKDLAAAVVKLQGIRDMLVTEMKISAHDNPAACQSIGNIGLKVDEVLACLDAKE